MDDQLSLQVRRTERNLLLVFIAAAVMLRIVSLVVAPSIEMDGIGYTGMAEFFAKGQFKEALKVARVPFYPMAISLFHLFIPDVELAGRVASLAFALGLILVCYLFTKRFFGERAALYAAFLVAIQPYMIRYSWTVLSESLATLLFTAAVFLFYAGLVRGRSFFFTCSGLLLTLSYLTRPEYIIYFVPLTLLLLVKERRIRHTAAFLVCFVVIALAFLAYLRLKSGFWVIDPKMLDWKKAESGASSFSLFFGIMTLADFLKNIPAVAGNFAEAMFPPLLLLAIFGFKGVEGRYRWLVVLLVVTHVLGRSFVPHTTQRYSVEFAPLIMVFASFGLNALRTLTERFRTRATLYYLCVVVVGLACLYQGFQWGHGRELHKEAGLYLRDQGRGAVAARLPIVSFYAQAAWVELPVVWAETKECGMLKEKLLAANVAFFAVDDRMEKDTAPLYECLGEYVLLREFTRGGDYVRVYRLSR
jgi:Dolichyl-phosphate-mannose-protein mannosyltransferase